MKRAFSLLGIVVFAGGLLVWNGAAAPEPAKQAVAEIAEAGKAQVLAAYGRLPLSFEANHGQTDGQVKFLSRGRGYTLFLTPTEAVLALKRPKGQESSSSLSGRGALHPPETNPKLGAGHSEPNAVLRMKLVGANPRPEVSGLDELPGKSNYFIGNDPSKWRTNVPHYAKVKYEDVYPGIDLVYYGNQSQRSGNPASSAGRQLEYDFIVASGADPGAIRLAFEGTEGLTLDPQGNLRLHLESGDVVQHSPLIYQEVEGHREPVGGGYVLLAENQVGFQVSSYDPTRPLVIDPVLSYSTYLGGSGGDFGSAIAVDAAGNAYVAGSTLSTDFPTTPGAFDTSCGTDGTCNADQFGNPARDAFVTKFSTTGSALVYSTYLGGSDGERGAGIAVDTAGNAYVTGSTRSGDFPTTPGAFQTTFGGGPLDAFVTKLNADGSALVYSTYLGGSEFDVGEAIAVDTAGNAYVTGDTNSSNFPTVSAFQATCTPVPGIGVCSEAFVSKLTAAGSALVYSTYLGGSGRDGPGGITVDAAGNAYVTGTTESTDFPTTPGAFDRTCGTDGNCNPDQLGPRSDAFVSKFTAAGSALVYSTYLGGSDREEGIGGIAVDAAGNAYVAGSTLSTDFPTTPGAFDTSCGTDGTCNADQFGNPARDAFVTKFSTTGSALVYSTYLGGSGGDFGGGIAVDSERNTYVVGLTRSSDFPTANPFQPTFNDTGTSPGDAFVTKLNPTGSALVYSTYLGGSDEEHGVPGITVDAAGNAYVTGSTRSGDFPTTPGAFQGVFAEGTFDAFVAKISPADAPGVALSPGSLTFAPQVVGTTSAAQTVTLLNSGTEPVTITSVTLAGANLFDFFITADTCSGATIAPDNNCTISISFAPTDSGSRSASLTITDNAPDSPQSVPLSGTGTFDFTISVSPASVTVTASQAATYTVTLTPQGGPFDNAISLACSNLPALSSCSFSPASVTPGASDATSTLTVSTTAPASVGPGLRFGPPPRTPVGVLWLGVLALALLGLTLARRAARRQLRFGLALGLLAWLLVAQVACGGGGGNTPSSPPPRPGTPTGTFNITITGTAGSLQHSTTATLVVQ